LLFLYSKVSDHSATLVVLELLHETKSAYKRIVWSYKEANFELLNTLIIDFNWNILLEAESTHEACSLFTSKFLEFIGKCIKNKTEITIRQNDKPWFN